MGLEPITTTLVRAAGGHGLVGADQLRLRNKLLWPDRVGRLESSSISLFVFLQT